MKKFALRFFVCVLIIPIFFLSGCLFFFDSQDEFSEGKITTFKACYRTENYEIDNTISTYAKLIVEQLYSNFGILNDYRHPSLIENKPDADNNSNYDKIRVQTDNEGIEVKNDIFWKWTFSQNLDDAESLTTPENAVTYYETPALQNAYYAAYVPPYSVAMEIVLYEIILNKTPTIFTVDIDDEQGTTKIYSNITKTKEIFPATETEECLPLSEIKNEFKTKAQYVGLTPSNVQVLNEYILNEVIGDGIIDGLYDRVIVNGQQKKLNFIIQQILQLEPVINGLTEQKSIYSLYPASYIKDFEGSSFYVGSDAQSFAHIPALEYQSVVLLPDENNYYLTIFLAFECEYDIEITSSLKYYNNQLETEISTQTTNISAGNWTGQNIYEFDFGRNRVEPFAVSQLKTSNQKVINNSTGLANFYNFDENSKIGILNKNKIYQSYFEFTFKITKNSSKDYYPYKVGVFGLWNA